MGRQCDNQFTILGVENVWHHNEAAAEARACAAITPSISSSARTGAVLASTAKDDAAA